MRRELKTNFGRKSFMKARLFRKNIGKALVLKKKERTGIKVVGLNSCCAWENPKWRKCNKCPCGAVF